MRVERSGSMDLRLRDSTQGKCSMNPCYLYEFIRAHRFYWKGGVSGADTGFMKGGGTVYETLPEAVHRGA